MSNEIVLTDANFEAEVINSDIPVLVDFWAEWCGPCKMIAPAVEEIAADYAGKVKVGKCDVDTNNGVAGQYMIRSIPTLLIFKNGDIADQIVGAVSKSDIAAKLDAVIG